MPSRLPPLRAIEIFVVAGRCLSFSEAARIVHLTPSAVSRRIRILETELGVDLFQRFNRRLELTVAGAYYLDAMSAAVELIKRGSDAIRPRRPDKVLRLTTVPLIGGWLMPRLASLGSSRPDLDIQVRTSGEVFDLNDGHYDAAVRFGLGRWPGLAADRLLTLAFFPVAAPGTLTAQSQASAAALDRATLLAVARAPQLWPQWFSGAGLKGYRPRRTQIFDSAAMMYQAAINGVGIALGDATLIEDHLAAGRLIKVFSNPPVRPRESYYLVYRRALRDRPILRALRRALVDDKPKRKPSRRVR
jgi:LysR family glycine cleavage system transcriptional activator